jgi:hypothetical protein
VVVLDHEHAGGATEPVAGTAVPGVPRGELRDEHHVGVADLSTVTESRPATSVASGSGAFTSTITTLWWLSPPTPALDGREARTLDGLRVLVRLERKALVDTA